MKLYGLCMLNLLIFIKLLLVSVDSMNVVCNIGIDKVWFGVYVLVLKDIRVVLMVECIELYNSFGFFVYCEQCDWFNM